ncbi:UNVERIFIED_CONTAM: hypothetical protein Sindi_2481100, partial [Sesamum indicum]
MQTRSRAHDFHDLDTICEAQVNGAKQDPPREQPPPLEVTPLSHEQAPLNREILPTTSTISTCAPQQSTPPKSSTPRIDGPTDTRSFIGPNLRRIYSSSSTSCGLICGTTP